MKSITLFLIFMMSIAHAQLPEVVSGRIERHENFPSQFVTARNVDVWLPNGYTPTKKYAVLYMHDGAMLFDSSITWTKTAWEVDEVLTKLKTENKIRDVIVVGIWNAGLERHRDYCPQKPYETLTEAQQDSMQKAKRQEGTSVFNNYKPRSDGYLKFIVKELKPFIDKTYSTLIERKNTFIAGSSMGGLISIYAICEYPKIFGGAACLSTHWPVLFTMKNNPMPDAIFNYMKNNLPDPKTHKIYFDYGTATLDSLYAPLQKQVDVLMKARGYTSKNWETKEFPGANHSETAWHKRLDIPMIFLLKY
jgi:predicted alpha/beta superfamily hydrolase